MFITISKQKTDLYPSPPILYFLIFYEIQANVILFPNTYHQIGRFICKERKYISIFARK